MNKSEQQLSRELNKRVKKLNDFIVGISKGAEMSGDNTAFFDSVEKVAEEELSVAQFSSKVIVNIDDCKKEYLKLFVSSDTEVVRYGYDASSQYKISSHRNSHHSFNVAVSLPGSRELMADVSVASKHGLKPLAAAVAVGDALGLSVKQLQKGITTVMPTPGRMRLFDGMNRTVIIDDTYNSSPLAAEAALQALYDMKAPQRVVVLGSMNELGAVSKVAHEKIGSLCNPKKLDLVITLGEQANKYIASIAEEQGCNVIRTVSPVKAGKVALQNAKEGAIVLVKGSQNGVFAEEAVKQLLANPSDINNLVRQSDFWMNKKAAQFTDMN